MKRQYNTPKVFIWIGIVLMILGVLIFKINTIIVGALILIAGIAMNVSKKKEKKEE